MHRTERLLVIPALLLAAPIPAGAADRGRDLAATCAGCHGTNGHARGDMKPLAGVPAAKIAAALADFRTGVLPSTVMGQIAKGYTDEQVQAIAEYFAAQPARRP